MTREISTTEALMTDPTTAEGAAYWQQRHDHEAALEQLAEDPPNGTTEDGYPDWYVSPGDPDWPPGLRASDCISDYGTRLRQDEQPSDLEMEIDL